MTAAEIVELAFTERRRTDRRGMGRPIGLHEAMWQAAYGDRRQTDRRQPSQPNNQGGTL